MRYVILIVCLLLVLAVALYWFLLPPDIEDYRWLVVAVPVSLLLLREVYEHMPGLAPLRSRAAYSALTVEAQEQEDSDDADEDVDEAEAPALAGLWTGTARIRPAAPAGAVEVLPLQAAFSHEPPTCCVLSSGAHRGRARIVAATILEYDVAYGTLDLQLVIDEGGRHKTFDAKLVLCSGRLVPEDDSDPVTVELTRGRFVPLLAAHC